MDAVTESRIFDAIAARSAASSTMHLNLDGFNQLFYRGQFRELLTATSSIDPARVSLENLVDIAVLRANALFELGDLPACRSILESLLGETAGRFPKQYAYVCARLRYMSGEYIQAQELFETLKKIADQDQDMSTVFKAELGLANIAYTQRNTKLLSELIDRMGEIEDAGGASEQLSLGFLRGHLAGFAADGAVVAEREYKSVLNRATKLGWCYFQKRALYFLVIAARRIQDEATALARIDLLSSMLDEDQDKYFGRLIKDRFQAGSDYNQPMRVDPQAMVVNFGGSLWNLHDCPQMFRFVELLHATPRFVSKAEVAKALWPHENYRKYLHDPRIFDLAKRLRKRIDGAEVHGISFLSGRAGYQLVLPKAS